MESKGQDKSETEKERSKPCCGSFCKWIGTPSFFIYLNLLLSQWGDWMWQFAVGIYLVHLSNGQLLLAAIFGFSGGVCVLLFGGIIGDWVDRNGRLKVVRVSLVIQNMSVMCSAICVCVVEALAPTQEALPYGRIGRILMEIAIIVLAISAQLANVAYTIAIEKDWIVVIAEEKSSNLANLNAGTRTLGLICKTVSPTVVGCVMRYGSLFASAIVIAGWNLVSVFVEYAILSHIYRMVPRLAFKINGSVERDKEMKVIIPELEPMNQPSSNDEIADKHMEANVQNNGILLFTGSGNKIAKETSDANNEPVESNEQKTCIGKVTEPFLILVRGWHTYAQQTVVFAGISLACLYMTVLGFDSITTGYIYANNVSELLVGVSMAMAGLTGVIGTLLFPALRRRFGLETTGLIAYSAEISCLILAVLSIWAPGSRFDPYFASRLLHRSYESSDSFGTNASLLYNGSATTVGLETAQNVSESSIDTKSSAQNYMSIILLLIGIISSRVGLWMADLVVTQLLQENVLEKERGIVNGVQNSLNMLMEMLKFVLVIVAPQIEIFGFHIIISFTFICIAGLFFVGHVTRVKRQKRLLAKAGSTVIETNVQ